MSENELDHDSSEHEEATVLPAREAISLISPDTDEEHDLEDRDAESSET